MGNELLQGWETIGQIGSGGFSKVYKIRKKDEDADFFSALKVVSIPQSEDEYRQYKGEGYDDAGITAVFKEQTDRIVSEFKLMHKLRGHTNIVSYEDHQIIPKKDMPGWDILIRMELCTPLTDYYNTVQFNEAEVIKLGTHICTALERCEQLNIVHRDIKPQNIFVSAFGDYKLGDFGIARVMDHATRATRVGTPTYIAPEVYNGAPSDNRGDIYCLGMVLYWLLNERRMPFLPLPPAMPTIAETEMANMRRLRGEPLPPPNNGSPALKAAVMKALAFNPAHRFATAAEFKAALTARQTITTAVKNGEETIAINRSQVTNKNQNNRVVTNQSRANNQQAGQKQAPKRSKAWILVLVLTFLIIGAGVAAILLLSKDDGNTSKQPSQTVLVEDSSTAEPEDVLESNPQLGDEDLISSDTPSSDDLESVAVGDYITFGNYEQDNNLDNRKEPIEWLVLDKQDGKVLVISKYAIDCQPYNTEYVDVTWETCTLRQWLNGTFINDAFTSTEQSKISTSYIINSDNNSYGTEGGNNTYDKVFLLSIGEANKYFSPDKARTCTPTAYAIEQGVYHSDSDDYGACRWLLRSPGGWDARASYVNHGGLVEDFGGPVTSDSDAVRPAMWISLSNTETDNNEEESKAVVFDTLDPSIKVGDYITFGNYEQDNDLDNGKEKIEWLVLDRRDDKILVISKYALDCQPYNTDYVEDITWETCSLRKWLNESFANEAFTSEEQSKIFADRAFLLSIDEAENYFSTKDSRGCLPTAYATAKGAWIDSSSGNCRWWLSSLGFYSGSAAFVYPSGDMYDDLDLDTVINGNIVDDARLAVRPALWINVLDTEEYDTPVAESKPVVFDSLDSSINIGDYITFGNYEQDNNPDNGKEAIDWLVLDVDGDKALVISKYGLDCQPYNAEYADVTWETCTLRQWLNESFLNTAFTTVEQSKILLTTMVNNDNPYQGTEGGNNTYGKVFMLSIDEASKYFSSSSASECAPTALATAQGVYTDSADGNCPWWLRSPGDDQGNAAYMYTFGLVNDSGSRVVNTSIAVRPALWINLES